MRTQSSIRLPLALVVVTGLALAACSGGSKKPATAGGAGGSEETGGSGGGGQGGSAGGAGNGQGGKGGGTGGALGGSGGGAGDAAAGVGGTLDAGADTGSTDGPAVDGAVKVDAAPGGPFALTSSAFAPGGLIIRKYRCKFEDVSPPLSWTPGPPATKSYAVTMRSAGSPHWALWDIPADTLWLPEKIERLAMPPVPAGSKQCKPNVDSSTWYGYAGACPMGGTNSRSYYFAVFALKVAVLPNVTPDSSIAQVNAAIMANQIGMATLIGMAAPNSP